MQMPKKKVFSLSKSKYIFVLFHMYILRLGNLQGSSNFNLPCKLKLHKRQWNQVKKSNVKVTQKKMEGCTRVGGGGGLRAHSQKGG